MALAAVAGAAAAAATVAPRSGDTGASSNVTRSMPRTAAGPVQGATTVMARTTTMQQVAPPRRTNWGGIAAFTVLLALVAGGIILFNVLKNNDKKTTEFPLPHVVGKPLDEAGKILHDDNHLLVKLQKEPTAGAAEGAVIRTAPEA